MSEPFQPSLLARGLSRRRFVAALASSLGVVPLAGFARAGDACARMSGMHHRATTGTAMRHPHPTPRPGITAAKVLKKGELHENADALPVFDMVRQMPQIVDGIRCHCGCAELPEFYSLLSCYEGDGMAQHCEICQGQGRLAFSLFKEGKSLDEIRAAIDAKYD